MRVVRVASGFLGFHLVSGVAVLFGLGLLAAAPAFAQLTLAIDAGLDPARDGESVLVELTATNAGVGSAANVTVELDFPANVAALNQNLTTAGGTCIGSGNFNTICNSGETVTWSLGTLPPGGRKTVSIAPVVNTGSFEPPDGTVIPFSARLRQGGTVVASASQSVTKLRVPVFEFVVDDSIDPVAASADLTYTLLYGRRLAGDSLGTSLSLTLAPGTSFVSASDGGVFAAGTVTWNLATLGGGLGGTRQVTVHVDTPVAEGTSLRATAVLQDGAANSARAQSVTAVQSDSPLQVAIEAFADPAYETSIVDAEVTVTNVGATTIDTVLEIRLDEYLGAFLDNLLTHGGVCSASGDLNSTCSARERMQWDLPPLAPGERTTVTLAPQITGGVFTPPDSTLIPFRAEVFEPLVGQVGDSRLARYTMRKRGAPEFELTVDESADPVAPGAPLSYTLAFGKPVAGTSTGTTLSFELPPETSFVSATGGGTHSAGVISWSLGTVLGGQGGTREVTVTVDPLADEGTLLQSIARIRDTSATPRVARSANATVVQSGSPLRLTVEASPDPSRSGETADVELTVTNVGGITMNPVLELRLDQSFGTFVENLLTHGGDCSVSGDLNNSCTTRERIRWELEPLAPGERSTVSFAPVVAAGVSEPGDSTLMLLRAEVFEELAGQVGESRLARYLVRKQNAKNLELQLDESTDPVKPGADLGYTLSFGKPTAGNATGTTLTFKIPAGTSFVSASDGGTLASGVVTWNLATVPAAQGGTRRVTVHVNTPVSDGTVIEAAARIEDGSGVSSSRARANTVVRSSNPFALSVEAIPDPIVTQEAADTQITVTNVGDFTVDPVLDLRLDDGFAAFDQNYLTKGGDCTVSGDLLTSCNARELVRWDLAPIAPGERVTVSLAPFLNGGVFEAPDGTLLPLRAEVYVPAIGETGELRIARLVVRKQNTHAFELLADESSDPVAPGASLTYKLTFGHPAAGTASGAILSFPLPAGTSFVSATGGGVESGGVVTWSLPPLPSGQGGSRQVTVAVGAGVQPGSLLATVARIQDGQALPASARAPVATAVQSGAPLQLLVTATPDPARPTNVLDIDLTVNNVSGTLVSGAVLQARVPDTISGFAEGTTTGGGDCNVSGNGNTTCEARERVVWALPNIPAFGSVSVSMPPQIFGGVFTPSDGTLIRFFSVVDDGAQSVNTHTVRVGFVDSDADGVPDGVDNCGSVANASQADGDADVVGDLCDNCPTLGNAIQTDGDADLVGDLCDSCTAVSNPRVTAAFIAANPWVTLTGGQRDDDHDGFGNKCDGKFVGSAAQAVGALDLNQFRASSGKNRDTDTCGTTGTRPCAIFDLDENTTAANALGALDLNQFRALSGSVPGPKCAACTGTGSVPLPCTSGPSGNCN